MSEREDVFDLTPSLLQLQDDVSDQPSRESDERVKLRFVTVKRHKGRSIRDGERREREKLRRRSHRGASSSFSTLMNWLVPHEANWKLLVFSLFKDQKLKVF